MSWIDLVLGLGLVCTCLSAMASKNLFQSIIMFITFGVILSLVWVRLSAPDLALAEAAIGAGLTGVLFLDALGHWRHHKAAKGAGND